MDSTWLTEAINQEPNTENYPAASQIAESSMAPGNPFERFMTDGDLEDASVIVHERGTTWKEIAPKTNKLPGKRMGAFQTFQKIMSSRVKESGQKIGKASLTEWNRELSLQWKNMSEDERKPYQAIADASPKVGRAEYIRDDAERRELILSRRKLLRAAFHDLRKNGCHFYHVDFTDVPNVTAEQTLFSPGPAMEFHSKVQKYVGNLGPYVNRSKFDEIQAAKRSDRKSDISSKREEVIEFLNKTSADATGGKRTTFAHQWVTKGILTLKGWPEDVPIRGVRQLTSAQIHAVHQAMNNITMTQRPQTGADAQSEGGISSTVEQNNENDGARNLHFEPSCEEGDTHPT